MLAVDDVNAAGGVDGRMLQLEVRDSNSGSERGFSELERLLVDDGVSYLIGPEEYQMSLDVVGAVKRNDVLHIMPGFTSPTITDSGRKGAWLRLAPSAYLMGCALATKAVQNGVERMRTIAAGDDYHLELASVFSSAFSTFDGRAFPTISVRSDQSSYTRDIARLNRYDADATQVLAYPGTAATIVREMSRSADVVWYFSPLARDEALLLNVPEGVLEDAIGVSPSLTSNVECDTGEGVDAEEASVLLCEGDAAERFARYYAEEWGVESTTAAAHYYYDAVIMLALRLEQAAADGLHDPTPQELLPYFIERSEEAERVAWDSLEEGLQHARLGEQLVYLGAAGEYEFNRRGQNTRAIIDTWVVNDKHRFAARESVVCQIDLIGD